MLTLFIGAIGVVFGDIGTSPLYALRETFAGHNPLPLDRPHVLGVLSLVFWSVMIIVSIKYVIIIMRADNKGEGGSLTLLALVLRASQNRPEIASLMGALGIFAAALFYGDSMITPAISVLSAAEGLSVVDPKFAQYVLPVTLGVLFSLFLIQRHGTGTMGALFGPIVLTWFLVLALLGIQNIGKSPDVLWALSPHHAVSFFWQNGWVAFLALGSVVLVVTGAEALYTDMGHFGRFPIRLGWYLLVLPALMLNYMGQGALLLSNPSAIANPFFLLAPEWARLPLVILACSATVIASQAVISGAFSVTRQAIQMGYLPRMTIRHTSRKDIGQIYIPFINWSLMACVGALVLGFGTSSNLAAAYGVAVTGTMLIDTVLIGMVMFLLWGWRRRVAVPFLILFLVVDIAFFSANAIKIPYGGWFPLAAGAIIFLLLTTWKRGRSLLSEQLARDAMPVDVFLDSVCRSVPRVSGTAIFLTGTTEGVPIALLHNLKHNKVLHERVVLLTVQVEDIPVVSAEHRLESRSLAGNFHRVILRYGFTEEPNIPKALANANREALGFFYEPMTISYFLSRETIIPSDGAGMASWREHLFAWMARSATSAMDFFHLPCNRVVELGSQVEI